MFQFLFYHLLFLSFKMFENGQILPLFIFFYFFLKSPCMHTIWTVYVMTRPKYKINFMRMMWGVCVCVELH